MATITITGKCVHAKNQIRGEQINGQTERNSQIVRADRNKMRWCTDIQTEIPCADA